MAIPVLFVIREDPRTSPRPAEAVRIAAGLAVGSRLQVAVYLRGPAAWMLSERAEEWVDGDHFREYLPFIVQREALLFLQEGILPRLGLTAPTIACREINDADLGALIEQYRYVVRW